LLTEGDALELMASEQSIVSGNARIERRIAARPSVDISSRTMVLALSTVYVLASLLLVIVELAQPPKMRVFPGIRFSNTVNSPGSRAIVAMYRDHLEWLVRPFSDQPLSPTGYIWGLRIAWFSLIAVQIAALWAVRRTDFSSLKTWIIGPAVACLIFLFYPPTSTDIYAYASFGWVAEHGQNPYLVTPISMPGDPYASFNDWTHVRTPYGPIWTGISRAIVHVTHEDPFWTTILYKIVATLPAFGLALLTYHVAKRFTDNRQLQLTAFIFVWWSPILITEAAATVHLDPLVMFLAMLGLICATGERFRSHRLGVALVVASALVKPITLPLIALLILTRIAGRERLTVVLKQMALDVLVVISMAAAGFAPFWDRTLPRAMVDNARILYTHHPLRYNPLWVWGFKSLGNLTNLSINVGGDAGSITRLIAMLLSAAVTLLLARALWRQRQLSQHEDDRAIAHATLRFLVWSWAAVTVIIGVLPVNAHPWYTIWSLPLLALLWVSDGKRDRTRPPVWLIGLQTWIFISFMVYHTLPKR
jgi:hypothetical protein